MQAYLYVTPKFCPCVQEKKRKGIFPLFFLSKFNFFFSLMLLNTSIEIGVFSYCILIQAVTRNDDWRENDEGKKVHVRVPISNSTSAFSVIYIRKQADNVCNLLFNSLTHCTWISNSVSIFSIKQQEKKQVKIQAYSWRFTKADAQVKGNSSRRLQALGISMHYNQTTGRDA